MYYLKKTLTISASHSLDLDYDSKCKNQHGHNWKIIVFIKGFELDKNGMLIDFSKIKEIVNIFDHKNMNEILIKGTCFLNPTAENIAKIIYDLINEEFKTSKIKNKRCCYRVSIQETEGNEATYEEDV